MYEPTGGLGSSGLELWEQSIWTLKLHQGSRAETERQIALELEHRAGCQKQTIDGAAGEAREVGIGIAAPEPDRGSRITGKPGWLLPWT